MPFIPIILALVFMLVFALATPLLLVLRYRTGTARRRGRRWVGTINLVSMLVSLGLFLWAAAITTLWVPGAFTSSLIGAAIGSLLGLLGLTLTRWERIADGLYYTPNRWLVLLITLAVASRLLYGLWRIWQAWQSASPDTPWLAAAGVPGSMAVAGTVLGYYLIYSAGVRLRLR